MRPNRIHITGNVGSGKTTLAKHLGAEFGLPVVSLDSVVWQRGWQKTPDALRAAAEQQMISMPKWIIEGVSSRVRAAADLVVFVDAPVALCLTRAMRRTIRHLRQQRPEFPPGCPEWRVVPRMLKILWSFPRNAGQDIWKEAAQDRARFRVIKPGDGVDRLIDEWQRPTPSDGSHEGSA